MSRCSTYVPNNKEIELHTNVERQEAKFDIMFQRQKENCIEIWWSCIMTYLRKSQKTEDFRCDHECRL